ncbi:MAG TPA: low molecular weight protein arginine phosphatase [Gemmatimonadaceae bacterium]|nr:low molecular weight protein arginine phosphatase [Gemmatimonadaceae bacterium]
MRIMFVCTGNTCRSPLAEAIARDLASRKQVADVEIGSAGTSAWSEAPASDGALLVGLERGLDLNTHRARQLSSELVERADLILAMGPHHLERIEALGGVGKAHLLTGYASHGRDARAISDPFGGNLDVYRAAADELTREIERVFDRIMSGRTSENP